MAKDKCIICGEETAYDESTHIDMRYNYVEGAGQLCTKCVNKTEATMDHMEHILVSIYTVKSTPNDAELGAKVRQIYYESQENNS